MTIIPYRLPLAVPYRWAKGVQTERAGYLVRAEVDGAEGWGEVAPPPEAVVPDALPADVVTVFERLNPSDPKVFSELEALAGHPWRARFRCGVVSAVLSARAAAAGLSLARFLGGTRPVLDRVEVNALITAAAPTACAEEGAAALARGQTTLKLKCTADRTLDLARVAAIRGVDADVKLRLDPNESWLPAWTLAHLEALAPFGIEYVEQPLPLSASLKDYAELRKRSPIPIALDHAVDGLASVQRIVEAGAADVLILKPQRLGGPDRLLEVADFALKSGLRCTVTNSLETAVGLTVALHCAALLPPHAAGLGTARFFARNVGEPPPIVAGHMAVPVAPRLKRSLYGRK